MGDDSLERKISKRNIVDSQESKGSTKRDRSNSGGSQTLPKPSSGSSSNLPKNLKPSASSGSTANPIQQKSESTNAINPPSTDVQMGQHMDSHRDPANRMLDRLGRVLHNGLPKKDKSPHLALVKLDDKVHIAGNSGRKRVKSRVSTKEILNITNSGATEEQELRFGKDISKLSALKKGTYHSGKDESDDLNEIQKAIETDSMEWHQLDTSKPSKGSSKHGEMALHKPISEYAHQQDKDKGKKKKDIYVGGVQKDCLFCQWAHAILNKYVYEELGHQVITSGTHGIPFPGWIAPQELLENKKALEAFKEKLKTLKKGNDDESWSMDDGGKVTYSGNYGDYSKPKNDSHPYQSDSE
ncbi:hypothetical protein LC609_35030 [Nostoc sp. XA013]|nr:hypothetical protein [Nostoc sp. XA013]